MHSLNLKTDDYLNKLDDILKRSLEQLVISQEDIFKIGEEARKEYNRTKQMLGDLKRELAETIDVVDKMTKLEKKARLNLVQVSKNFKKYDEEDIKESYDKASRMQLELTLKIEEEKQLRAKRDEMERALRSINETLRKADNLTIRLSTVIDYLESDMNILSEQLKGLQEKQVVGMRIIRAQEEERRRIARDIHDGPAQMLANIIIMTEICDKKAQQNDFGGVKQELGDLKEAVRMVLKEMRKTIYDLRPMALDDLGLIPAIKKYVSRFNIESEKQIRFVVIGEEVLPRYLDTTLFRIIQEGIANVEKHSQAKNVNIKLETGMEYVNLIIEDDGQGFHLQDITLDKENSLGLGLSGIKERARLMDGEAKIESKPGHGTRIFVRIPISDRGRA